MRKQRLQSMRMADEFNSWLDQVGAALRSINMRIDDWQSVWPFDFSHEHEKGTDPDTAAMKANHFWWHQQNKSMGRECDKVPGCWLPRGHEGDCQPIYEPGDYIKVEFEGEGGMPGEWMWVIVQGCDDNKRVVFGRVDNEPLNEYSDKVKLGSQLAISYGKVREYKKPSEFAKR